VIDFINIGPGRSASTWFYRVMGAHPEICFARVKETEFFTNNRDKGLDYYQALFTAAPGQKLGEVSNMYYADEIALKEIFEVAPNVKIVVNVRSPFTLLQSMYNFSIRRGLESDPKQFCDMPLGLIMGSGYTSRLSAGLCSPSDTIRVLDSVLLLERIRLVTKIFPLENIHFLHFDSVTKNPRLVYENLCRFLDIEIIEVPDISKKTNGSIAPRIPLIGSVATKFAYFLRKNELFGLLDRLHNSSFVREIFFKKKPVTADIIEELSAIHYQKLQKGLDDLENYFHRRFEM
jgi:hypothetical protein